MFNSFEFRKNDLKNWWAVLKPILRIFVRFFDFSVLIRSWKYQLIVILLLIYNFFNVLLGISSSNNVLQSFQSAFELQFATLRTENYENSLNSKVKGTYSCHSQRLSFTDQCCSGGHSNSMPTPQLHLMIRVQSVGCGNITGSCGQGWFSSAHSDLPLASHWARLKIYNWF